MRRALHLVMALLLVLHVAAVSARAHAPCCDACPDMAACVTMACTACLPVAAMPAASPAWATASSDPVQPASRAIQPAARAAEIWRPPRGDAASSTNIPSPIFKGVPE